MSCGDFADAEAGRSIRPYGVVARLAFPRLFLPPFPCDPCLYGFDADAGGQGGRFHRAIR